MHASGSILKLTLEPADERFSQVLNQFEQYLRNVIASVVPANLGIQIDDIQQEVRIKLWKAFQKDLEIKDYASYIHRIAFTTTIDAIRRVKARKEEQFFTANAADESSNRTNINNSVADQSPGVDEIVESEEILRHIERILSTMNANSRSVIKLYLQGLNTTETAAVCGWSEPKARNVLYRALNVLRNELKAAGIDYK
jgi:RNA polymerase sigma-70 factor (ECF subfamily)